MADVIPSSYSEDSIPSLRAEIERLREENDGLRAVIEGKWTAVQEKNTPAPKKRGWRKES